MNILSIFYAIISATGQGLLWSILAIGVFICFKILNFSDLTSEGSFAVGGCVAATLIGVFGWNPILSLIIATMAGMIAGCITGLLHTKLQIPAILSGILTMIALYSINLRIMKGSNISLLGKETIVSNSKEFILNILNIEAIQDIGMKDSTYQILINIILGLIISIAVIIILYWFFGTEIGCVIRATGNNEAMVRAQGANTDKYKILGLVIGNGLIALSGAVVAQSQGYSDVGMGTGAIVIGLASIVIGEVIIPKKSSFLLKLFGIVLGAIIYRVIIAVVLQLGLNTDYMKLLTAIIVAFALGFPVVRANIMSRIKEGRNHA